MIDTDSLTLVHRDPPTRWPEIITAMQSAGCSLRQIAGALAVPHTTVQKWQQGATPNFEDGTALLRLFETLRPLIPHAVQLR